MSTSGRLFLGFNDYVNYFFDNSGSFRVTIDLSSAVPENHTLVTNTQDSGPGSLRNAITCANSHPGRDTISFAVSGTINLASPLPPITDPVVIDGDTAPGYSGQPLIELNGASAGADANGLVLDAGDSTVQSLVLDRFATGAGIAVNSNDNLIRNCHIGTNILGTAALGNLDGVVLTGSGNTVGGVNGGNIISGNARYGVEMVGNSATANMLSRNAIGTTLNAENALGNGAAGVFISQAPGNIVGLTGDGNLISGNQGPGVEIDGTSATKNVVQANRIGTNLQGTVALANGNDGVLLQAPGNTVGGTLAGARNTISGNSRYGIEITGALASGNLVQGNFIGTDITGSTDLGNGLSGVGVFSAHNTIGGLVTGARNIISGNLSYHGVLLQGASATANLVQGNYIGTDVTGTQAVGNSEHGVLIDAASNNVIGGTEVGARNVIAGNGNAGLVIDTSAQQNLVQGNYIGVDVSGMRALPNGLLQTNPGGGILIRNALNNLIGGTVAGAGNVISGNSENGVQIDGSVSTGNVVQSNYIGTSADRSSPLGNASHGVFIADGASNNTLAGNTLAFNGGSGVVIVSGVNNGIRHNAIFSNARLGIDLGNDGVTPNDYQDPDEGPNHLQNFPVLLTAFQSGSRTFVQGMFNSTLDTVFNLEFFANTAGDPSGYGEGEHFLDSRMVLTDDLGDASYTFIFPVAVPAGQFVTATATDPNNNTSEFSAWVMVGAGQAPPPSAGSSAPLLAGNRGLDLSSAVVGSALVEAVTSPPWSGHLWLASQPGQTLRGEEDLVSSVLSMKRATEESFSTERASTFAQGQPIATMSVDTLDLLAANLVVAT
ncbi:MAG TPA: right-handed parallel beta-helix repeat-containing protein [Gemmataceae bacterium]|nr:right-handed parallel beta-helix repeat-containing protein [Gemmataceae bacterium]